jgi:hypothetical protein
MPKWNAPDLNVNVFIHILAPVFADIEKQKCVR